MDAVRTCVKEKIYHKLLEAVETHQKAAPRLKKRQFVKFNENLATCRPGKNFSNWRRNVNDGFTIYERRRFRLLQRLDYLIFDFCNDTIMLTLINIFLLLFME